MAGLLRFGLAALAFGAAATPAAAQLPSGVSGYSSTIVTADNEEALRTLTAFATCYARTNAADGFALLATDPGSVAESTTYRHMFRSDNQACLGDGTSLSVPVTFVRGAIAEALLERGAPVPAALVRAAPAPGAEIRRYTEAARCYAANHGAAIRTMLAASPGGQRELAALRPLADDFFRCMPANAQDRRFNATHLRYLLAEALLRLPSATASAAER
jgi:hypothetical protein